MRLFDADALIKRLDANEYGMKLPKAVVGMIKALLDDAPIIDAIPIEHINLMNLVEVVRCKECKHRPIKEDPDGEDYGFNIIKPNGPERCPCLVEDGWYSWMPKNDFYCGFGEREDE